MKFKAVLLWLFCSTVWFVQVQALFGLFHKGLEKDRFGDYVVPNEKFKLQYYMPDNNTKKLVLYNNISKTGLVFDGASERVAALNSRGDKIVMDMTNEKYYEEDNRNHIPEMQDNEFEDLLRNYDTTTVLIEKPFNMGKDTDLPAIFDDFCDCFKNLVRLVRSAAIYIWSAIKIILSPILSVLKLFGAFFVSGVAAVFTILAHGFLAILNIFKWLGKLLSKIVGGISMFLDKGIKFVLNLIITAANGAIALWEIFKCFIEKYSLMSVLKFMIKIPKLISYFISGLGGKIVEGVTGVFEIISKIFSFDISQLFKLVNTFIKMILDFFRFKRPTHKNIEDATNRLLDVADDQKKRYNNAEDFKEYEEFLLATKGKSNYKIHGIPVGRIVDIIVTTKTSAKRAVLKIFNAINPFASFRTTLPVIMVSLIKNLNTTEGISYVKQIIPSINLPDQDILAKSRSLAADLIIPENLDHSEELLKLPPPDMLKAMPIVKEIYNMLDEEAMNYLNTSMEALLEAEHVRQLVEFTTDVIALR